MADVCSDCGKPLGRGAQTDLFGGPARCIRCLTNHEADGALDAIEGDASRDLTEWEEGFVDSLRRQRREGRDVSEKQYEKVEQVRARVCR